MDEQPGQSASHVPGVGTHDASSRLAFLARASELLASASTDYVALERLAQLAVPALADWCAIDLLDDASRSTRVAVVHTDPAKVAIAAELERRYPPDPDSGYGVPSVLRTGQSELYTEIGERQLLASARDPEHLELIHKLGGFHSAMIVPLGARGKTLGAITLVSAESGRRFTSDDLAVAEDLARRAGLAVENARLTGHVEASERRLEALVDSIGAIVWEADPATRQFSFVSKRSEDILGYPAERWVSEPGFRESIVHIGDLARVIETYTRANERGGDHDIEYRVVAADGRTVWIRDVLFVVPDERGRPERIRGVMVDITSRISAELQAQAEHATTRVLAEATTLAEAAPRILETICRGLGWDAGALWVADPAAGVLRCHTAWSDPPAGVDQFAVVTRGYQFAPGRGLPGRVWAAGGAVWIPDVVVDDNFPRAHIARANGLHGAFGFPIVLRGNVLGVLEFFHRKIRQPDDDLLAMLVTIGTQIGQFMESSEAAVALRESHARGRAMLASSLDCFISMDHEGRVIEFNPAAERTFGYAREDVIGKELAGLIIPAEHRADHRAGLARYLETCEGRILGERVEMTATRADGTTFPIELSVAAVDSSPPIFTGYLRDITEQKVAEHAVRESRERLSFLAEASALLSTSLNYRTVLERLANLVVPTLADWCAVDVLEDDGTLRRVAVAHADPTKRTIARQLTNIRPDQGDGHILREVLASGEPLIASDGIDACGGYSTDLEQRRIVAELGCHTAMIVPLVARGRTIGAVTLVSTSGDRAYGQADLSLAEDVARRAALAVDNARLYRERSHVARTLQRSLLPPHLPRIPGVEVAARYQAAGEGNEVGGDFYDLFRTGKDDWAVMIGDVCGKGADAAALTALARYTVRAAAMQARKPSRVLQSLNEALLTEAATRDSMDQRFCTIAYARVRPIAGGIRLTAASGGHPVPLVIRADGRIESLCTVGTLIGVLADPTLSDHTTELGPGDEVVFYTDGITEARGQDGVFGDERFMDLLKSCAGLGVSNAAERIESAVLEFQEGNPRDDIALMILRVGDADDPPVS